MSAFLPSARRGSRPAPQSARGFVLYDGGDDAASDYDFVYDVSDDDVVERDIDAEIEARERANRATRAAVELATAPRAQLGQTMSQRMLSSLNQSRVKGSRAFSATAPYPATEKLADEPTPLPRSASRHGLDMFDAHGGRASSSCADRLEARISKSFLSRQESSSTEADDGHDMSALYSGRRTYPAESIKKADPRLSDTGPAPTPVETKMMALLAQERATRSADAFQREDPTPERDVSSGKGGVSFHFYGGSSIASRGQGMALTDGSADARSEPIRTSHAVVMPDRSRPQPLPAHVALASQLGEIETLVDGIERCMAVAALSSLADRVVGELELLKQSTQQIRSNGTTLILQEVGRQQTETTFALRRLVTRAVSVHKRIEDLILSVKRQAV